MVTVETMHSVAESIKLGQEPVNTVVAGWDVCFLISWLHLDWALQNADRFHGRKAARKMAADGRQVAFRPLWRVMEKSCCGNCGLDKEDRMS